MPQDFSIRIVRAQTAEEFEERLLLCGCSGIGRITLFIQSSLVTDTDTTGIKPFGMGADRIFRSSEVELPVPCNVVVVAAAEKASGFVIAFELLETVPLIALRRRAVNDYLLYFSHLSTIIYYLLSITYNL